ncbi:hypothetical protein ACFQ60_15220 [Streptomyces zhihengii]|uniref:Uncharacterized protein n=1 Tax=Streptomyces zhihengii TaxID=1818004 RepID=A0ABS2UXC8_9ACTN|nr:hypothetical protein [Streptomyces zhihengii]MBM9622237.1 hypothetical protein [Streptomyces zhihengii]
MKAPKLRIRPAVALLIVLVAWLLLTGIAPAAAAPAALIVQGGATILGTIPGPALLVLVLVLGWTLNRKFPPAAVPTTTAPAPKRTKPKRPAPRTA